MRNSAAKTRCSEKEIFDLRPEGRRVSGAILLGGCRPELSSPAWQGSEVQPPRVLRECLR
jgi:hypothetical protein